MPSGGEPSTEALNLGNGPKTVVPICWDLNGDGPHHIYLMFSFWSI